MIKKLFACSFLGILISCAPESQNKNLKYQNIVILSDMSSRIDNKRSKDLEEIDKIIKFFTTECVKPGEKIGDKSSIAFSPLSEKTVLKIDIDEIKSLGEKQAYINSTGKYRNSGLNQSIHDFKDNIASTYSKTRNPGLDLISVLIEKIKNEPIIKKDTFLTDGIDTTFVKFDNHIYIFTDGYLEYLNKSANSEYYFSTREIKKVREASKLNGSGIEKALKSNRALGLPPSKNRNNKFVHLHILETHERDKNDKLQTYQNINGERDNEILEAVWRKWALESGFKSLEWKKY